MGIECELSISPVNGLANARHRFNIYIYDYCNKRGFHKTANALLSEADIPEESQPPINAKQGLLFEYVIIHNMHTFTDSADQVVERVLGSVHSEEQWAWFGGCVALHSGAHLHFLCRNMHHSLHISNKHSRPLRDRRPHE